MPRQFLRAIVAPLADLAYPPTCPYCERRLTHIEQTLCDDCRMALLPEDTWRCGLCGATGGHPKPPPGLCPFCPPPSAHYRGVLSSTRYGELTARCIHDFKYRRRLEMGGLIADVMISRLGEPARVLHDRIGWVVPVPLHWTRRIWRGFNQSEVLARRLGGAIGVPYANALRRTRWTRSQARIPSHKHEERERNVRGAFSLAAGIKSPPPGVLLVDDVVTTAHTVGECARVLSEAGAPEVWIACFARA